jgi:NTE family protein
LAGGGAHGSVQWGSLQALSETDIIADRLIGTSAGALTAAVFAEDPIAATTRLAYVWGQVSLDVLLGDSWMSMMRAATRRKRSLADNKAEIAALQSILHARDFAELTLPMAAIATDLADGSARAFDSGDLISALLASSAIPGVLPPIERGGRYYVDGLASANLPARLAVERGAGSIIVLDTGSREAPAVSTNPTKVVPQVNRILNRNQRLGQLQYAAKHVPTIVLPTPWNLGAALDFRDTQRAASLSYELGRSFLIDLAGHVGRKHMALHAGLYARPSAIVNNSELASLLIPIAEQS